MKKIPIILAGLSIMGVVSGSFMAPIYATSSDNVVNNLANDDVLYLESNTYDARFNPDYFMMSTSVIQFKVDFSKTGQYIKRLILVYYDYENGITELEADARLPYLGTEDYSDWAVKIDDMDGLRVSQQKTTILNSNLHARPIDNKTDLMYYAVEYGNRETTANNTTKWSNTAWIRGKLDFRPCVHSKGIDVTRSSCSVKSNSASGVMDLFVNGKPVDEQVISWSEEWRLIQEERLGELEDGVADLEKMDVEGTLTLELLENETSEIKDLFKTLGVTLPKTENAEDLLKKLADLKERYDTLWRKYDLNDDDNDDKNNPGDENDEKNDADGNKTDVDDKNQGANDDLKNPSTPVASNTQNISTRPQQITLKNNSFASRAIKADSGRKVLYSTSNKNAQNALNGDMSNKDENGKNDELVSSKVENSEATSKFDNRTDEAVDLPTLGKTTDRRHFLWLIIPVVGVFIMIVLWLKRQREQK